MGFGEELVALGEGFGREDVGGGSCGVVVCSGVDFSFVCGCSRAELAVAEVVVVGADDDELVFECALAREDGADVGGPHGGALDFDVE